MAHERMALAELLEKGSDSDVLREMIGDEAQRLMHLDVEGLVGVARGERGEGPEDWRNGCRERDWHTRSGAIALCTPKLRRGSYFPAFLEPRRSSDKALAAVVQEGPTVQGISTRTVDELVRALGMRGISKSQVSRLCEEVDEQGGAFLERPLEGHWPYLSVDATFVKARQPGRNVSVAMTIAAAVNREGLREVLGMATGPSKAEPSWTVASR